jgi:hypothetical protein
MDKQENSMSLFEMRQNYKYVKYGWFTFSIHKLHHLSIAFIDLTMQIL